MADYPYPDPIVRVTELMLKQHPDWEGREWIRPGVGCLCAEHGKTGNESPLPGSVLDQA